MFFLWTFVILFFSVVLHEVAHGYVALRFGDTTAKFNGRLTLNPLKHIDPLGSILLPLLLLFSGTRFIIGWAKPVPINPANFYNRRRDLVWVSLAGPLTNFTLAFICSLIFKAVPASLVFFKQLLLLAIQLNLLLGLFNLIPIPPLDGSRAVAYFLHGKIAYWYDRLEPYGLVIIFFLAYTGALKYLLHFMFFLFNPLFRILF